MLPPNISEENIVYLRKKLDLKGIYTWDLQEEMIDLFSSKIEKQWAENPSISFEKALDKEFSHYGRFDLMKLQDQLTEKLSKEANRDLWNRCKELFELPMIVATFSAVIFILVLLAKFGNVAKDTLLLVIMISSLISTGMVFFRTQLFRKYQLAANIKLNIVFPLSNMAFILLPHINHLTFENREINTISSLTITTAILSFMFLLNWVCFKLTTDYYKEIHRKYSRLM